MVQGIYKKYLKKINIWYAVFAMLFSAMVIISRHIFNRQTDLSTIENVYVTDFHFVDGIAWLGTVPVIYILMKAAAFVFSAAGPVLFQEKRSFRQGIWVLAGSFVLIMLMWFPYLPSYWPGGIYSDTVDSITMALYKDTLDNHNPILYTLIWRLMFWVTGAFSGAGEYGGLKLFTVVQTLLMAAALSWFVYRCYRWGIHKGFVVLCLLVFALFPLYPFYGVSMWKDTLFSLAVFDFSIFLYHIFSEKGAAGRTSGEMMAGEVSWDISPRELTQYCVLSILIIFLRNNGIYVAAFYSAAITVICLKNRKAAVKIGAASFLVLLVCGMIQGPVYDRCGYNVNRSTESLGIPLQQAAYIVSTDGIVAEEDREVLEQMLPLERWKELYNPIVADTIKFSPEFDRSGLEENAGAFIKTYLHLAVKNPVKAIKAYLLSTMGFWDIFESSSTAYICNFHFGNVEYFMSDYFDYYLDISFKDFAEPKHYISAAVFVWIMIGTIFICLARHNYRGLAGVMPTLGVWLSIMIATPVAFSFRYVYALFLCTPLYLLICGKSFPGQSAVSETEDGSSGEENGEGRDGSGNSDNGDERKEMSE